MSDRNEQDQIAFGELLHAHATMGYISSAYRDLTRFLERLASPTETEALQTGLDTAMAVIERGTSHTAFKMVSLLTTEDERVAAGAAFEASSNGAEETLGFFREMASAAAALVAHREADEEKEADEC